MGDLFKSIGTTGSIIIISSIFLIVGLLTKILMRKYSKVKFIKNDRFAFGLVTYLYASILPVMVSAFYIKSIFDMLLFLGVFIVGCIMAGRYSDKFMNRS